MDHQPTDTQQVERPWTAREAAQYLGYSEEVVRRWARSGKLRGWRDLIGRWRFEPADVRAAAGRKDGAPAHGLTVRAADIAAHVQAAREQLKRYREQA